MALYSAGEVSIEVKPDTSGFRRRLKELLDGQNDLSIPVNFNPDTGDYERVFHDINNRTADNLIKLRADDSELRKYVRSFQQAQAEQGKQFDTSRYDYAAKRLNDIAAQQRKLQTSERKAAQDMRTIAKQRAEEQTRYDTDRQTRAKQQEKLEQQIQARYQKAIEKTQARLKQVSDTASNSIVNAQGLTAQAKAIEQFQQRVAQARTLANQRIQQAEQLRDQKLSASRKEYEKTLANLEASEQRYRETSKARMAEQLGDVKQLNVKMRELRGESEKLNQLLSDNKPVKRAQMMHELLGKYQTDLRSMMSAMHEANPLGSFEASSASGQAMSFMKTLENLDDMLKEDKNKQIHVKFVQEGYEQVSNRMREVMHEMARVREEKARVGFYADGAERIDAEIARLKSKYVRIPVDIDVEMSNLAARYREAAARVKANPDARFKVNLDLDTTMAKEHIQHFERAHNQLKMDIDLQSKLASAHLAYLSRPRTVDIYARVKETNLGKIINGMTFGATGIQGAQNQFNSLVKLFDNLDRVAPRIALIGGALSAVTLGATNAITAVSGMGLSLAKLSSAAWAVPASLGAGAAALFTLHAAFKKAADGQNQYINALKNQLNGLNTKVAQTFWQQASAPLNHLANTIAPTLTAGLNGVAQAEGRVVAGLARMAEQAGAQKNLEATLGNSRRLIDALSPSVSQLGEAFLRVSAVSGKYLTQFAQWAQQGAFALNQFVQSATGMSRIQAAMNGVREQFGFLTLGFRSLAGIIKGTFGTLASQTNGFESIAMSLAHARTAVESSGFQTVLRSLAETAHTAQVAFRGVFHQIGVDIYSSHENINSALLSFSNGISGTLRNISGLIAGSSGGIKTFAAEASQGFQQLTAGLRNAAPMFGQLIAMAGTLTKTFAGTFTATLQSIAPTLRMVASITQQVANTFNMLPTPIKGAIGIWATFGRAAVSAFSTVKEALANHILNTARLKATMLELGVPVKQATASMGSLLTAVGKLSGMNVTGLTAQMQELGAATRSVAVASAEAAGAMGAMNRSGGAGAATGLSAAARTAKTEATAVKTAAVEVAASQMQMGAAMRSSGMESVKAAGKFGKFGGIMNTVKGVGTGLFSLLGGFTGLGLTLAVGAATTAWSAYQESVNRAQEDQEDFDRAARAMPGSLAQGNAALRGLGNMAATVYEHLQKTQTAWDALFHNTAGAVNAATALKEVGVNAKDAAKSIAGTDKDYQQLMHKLEDIKKKASEVDTSTINPFVVNATAQYQFSKGMKEANARQAEEEAKKQREEALNKIRKMAEDNGSKLNIDHLNSLNISLEQMTALVQSDATKKELAAQANKLYTDSLREQRQAVIESNSMQRQYGETVAALGGHISNVQKLIASGQAVWDAQANSFNTNTEAGREASDTISNLYQSGQNMVASMINSGASWDQVNGKINAYNGTLANTLKQMGFTDEQTKQLIATYGMVPETIKSDFDAHTEEAKGKVDAYLQAIRGEFPADQSQRIYDMLFQAETAGAITSVNDMRTAADLLTKDPDKVLYFTADGHQAVGTMDEVRSKCTEISEGVWVAQLNANDNVSSLVTKLNNDKLNDKTADMWLFDRGSNMVAWLNHLPLDDKHATASIRDAVTGVISFANKFQLIDHNAAAHMQDAATGILNAVNAKRLDPKSAIIQLIDLVSNAVIRAQNTINGLHGRSVYINTVYNEVHVGRSLIGRPLATGGRVHGPGTWTSDSIPARLSNNEMVIRAAAVNKLDRKYGSSLLEYINQHGDLPENPHMGGIKATRRQVYAFSQGGRVQAQQADTIMLMPRPSINYADQLSSMSGKLDTLAHTITRMVSGLQNALPVIIQDNTPSMGIRDLKRGLQRV